MGPPGTVESTGGVGFIELSAPPETPLAGTLLVYSLTDHKVYQKDSSGNVSQIGVTDHVNLANKGTNTHAEIDTHLAAGAPHSGHALSNHTHAFANLTSFNTLGNQANLTISNGAVTATQSFHGIDTEGGASIDNLDTINGGSSGDLLIVRLANNAHDVQLRHLIGNIQLAGAVNVTLTTNAQYILLLRATVNWVELLRVM